MSTKASREQFEVWFKECDFSVEYFDKTTVDVEMTERLLKIACEGAWTASRAAVVLPEKEIVIEQKTKNEAWQAAGFNRCLAEIRRVLGRDE